MIGRTFTSGYFYAGIAVGVVFLIFVMPYIQRMGGNKGA